MKKTALNFVVGGIFLIATILIYFEHRELSDNILLVCTPTFIGSLIFLGFGIYFRCKQNR